MLTLKVRIIQGNLFFGRNSLDCWKVGLTNQPLLKAPHSAHGQAITWRESDQIQLKHSIVSPWCVYPVYPGVSSNCASLAAKADEVQLFLMFHFEMIKWYQMYMLYV